MAVIYYSVNNGQMRQAKLASTPLGYAIFEATYRGSSYFSGVSFFALRPWYFPPTKSGLSKARRQATVAVGKNAKLLPEKLYRLERVLLDDLLPHQDAYDWSNAYDMLEEVAQYFLKGPVADGDSPFHPDLRWRDYQNYVKQHGVRYKTLLRSYSYND